MSYDVESPSVMCIQQPAEQEKKSNACCIWSCVIGAAVAVLLFLVAFNWSSIVGSGTPEDKVSDFTKQVNQTKIKLDTDHKAKVERVPDKKYAVPSAHWDPSKPNQYNHAAPGHKVGDDFWCCSESCQSLFKGDERVNLPRLEKRKRHFKKASLNKKLCIICRAQNDDFKTDRGQHGEDIGIEDSDDAGRTGQYKRSAAIVRILKPGRKL